MVSRVSVLFALPAVLAFLIIGIYSAIKDASGDGIVAGLICLILSILSLFLSIKKPKHLREFSLF